MAFRITRGLGTTAAVLLLVVAGCDALSLSGIFGLAPDAGVSHLAPDGGGAREAGAGDAAAVDAPLGARVPEDARFDSDASRPLGFCAALEAGTQGFFFCDDFDEDDGGLAKRWDQVVAPSGGEGFVALDPKEHVSPPYSFLVSLPDASGASPAFLGKSLGGAGFGTLQLSFDLRLGTVPSSDSTYYANIMMSTGANGSSVTAALQTAGGATFLQERILTPDGGLFFPNHQLPQIPVNVWTHIVLAFTFKDAGTSSAVATLGDAVSPVIPLASQWGPLPATVAIGFYYVNAPEVARSANIDNVLINGTAP